jgi:hypothetical protein
LLAYLLSYQNEAKFIQKLWERKKNHLNLTFPYINNIFSSPELKAQIFKSPVVRLFVNFYIFDFFSRTTGSILTRLGTNHQSGGGGVFKIAQMKNVPAQGEIIAKE